MAYVLSHFFFTLNPARYAVGAVVITRVLAAQPPAHPVHDPPRGPAHADARPAPGVSASWSRPWRRSSSPRSYVFDVLFFWMLGYTATGWIPIYPEEKRAFYARYRAWAKEVSG